MPKASLRLLDSNSITSVVEKCLAFAMSEGSSATKRTNPPLTSPKSTNSLSRAELDAVANFLGRSGEALVAALERVNDLKTRNLPISLPKMVQVEDKYANRSNKAESIADFLRRIWGPHMEAGLLTRQYLREQDLSAERALDNWMRTKPLPSDIRVLRIKDTYDAASADMERVRDAMRLTSAAKRRGTLPRHD